MPGEGLSVFNHILTHSLQSLLVNHRRSGQVENTEVRKCRSTNTGVQKWKYGNQSTEVGVRKTVVRKPEYGNRSTETVSALQRFPLAPQVESTANHTHACTHTLVPQEGLPGIGLSFNTHTHSLNVVCLLVTPRGVPGEGLSLTHTHTVRFLVNHPRSGTSSVCSSHAHAHTYSGTPRGVPGIHTHTHSLNVVCPLVTPRGVPGEGLSLTHTQSVSW